MEVLNFRKANIDDLGLYFEWANDSLVREHSYNSNKIDMESHSKWFKEKLEDNSCLMLIFQNDASLNVGQVRIEKKNDKESVIGISIDLQFRGKGYAKEMIKKASDYFLRLYPSLVINAFIKEENQGSKKAFEKAGFQFFNNINYEGASSFHYIKKQNENR